MTMRMRPGEVSAIYYLRPGNLSKDFFVGIRTGSVDKKGRSGGSYKADEKRPIRAVFAEATPQEKARWEQIQHPITHTLVERGRPKARAGDMLMSDSRRFYIQGVDEPGQLGLYTIYYVEERMDV